ncbi:porin, partial [Klebsiella pneumoniae]|uniref:porin n=1 Tax=Klebsiella pneumoniae TaxID=573 RepID=UPI001D17E6F3
RLLILGSGYNTMISHLGLIRTFPKGKDLERGYGDQDILKYVDVGATYYFNKNMSTYVDYKINLLDDNSFTRNAGISTDDVVALGLVYQF